MAGFSRCAALVGVLCAAGVWAAEPPQAKKRRGDDESKKITLPHHSFAAPLEYKNLLEDWVISGASLFERQRLLIHPGVQNLAGFAFNKWPLLTTNFEAVLEIRISGEKDLSKVPVDQTFGFWYVKENISESFNETSVIQAANWNAGLQAQGFSLAGMKNKFDGLGATFSMSSAKKPTISLLTSDGLSVTDLALSSKQSKDIDFRNTLNRAKFKIRVNDKMVEGFLKQSPSLAWQECFKLELPQAVKPGGFLGFSAWSGSEGQTTPDLVSVTELEVNNFDENSIGEDMKDVSVQIQEAYRDMLTDEHRHFLDQKSQTEHLERLAVMLSDHISSALPEEDKLFNQVQALSSRVTTLGEQCRELKQETNLLIEMHGEKNAHAASVKSLKHEIVGLRRIFQKDSASSKQKMEAVTKNLQEVSTRNKASSGGTEKLLSIAKQTEKLEKTVSSRGSQMSLMMFFLLVAVTVIGSLMWTRMHYYEKKHFL